jgi:hypothetical protein
MAEDRKSQALPNKLIRKLFFVNNIKNKNEAIKKGKILKFHCQENALHCQVNNIKDRV